MKFLSILSLLFLLACTSGTPFTPSGRTLDDIARAARENDMFADVEDYEQAVAFEFCDCLSIAKLDTFILIMELLSKERTELDLAITMRTPQYIQQSQRTLDICLALFSYEYRKGVPTVVQSGTFPPNIIIHPDVEATVKATCSDYYYKAKRVEELLPKAFGQR